VTAIVSLNPVEADNRRHRGATPCDTAVKSVGWRSASDTIGVSALCARARVAVTLRVFGLWSSDVVIGPARSAHDEFVRAGVPGREGSMHSPIAAS